VLIAQQVEKSSCYQQGINKKVNLNIDETKKLTLFDLFGLDDLNIDQI
jgi:hypothetical protein